MKSRKAKLSSPPQVTLVWRSWTEAAATTSLNKAVSAALLGALVCSVCQKEADETGLLKELVLSCTCCH